MVQTRLQQGYCIDTCALIDLWRRHYPPDIFPGLWSDIEKLVNQGLLIAPKEVFNELKKVDDDLIDWAKNHQEMFIPLDEEQLQEVTNILARSQGLIDARKITEADPFLIALAKCKGWTVITSEKPKTDPNAPPKIPDVCRQHNVKCISVIEFFREQGWEY
jgi:predicted nucleic acid-binding protein